MSDIAEPRTVTAAVLLIGDEILSGRTKDANLGFIATFLGEIGIQVAEARVVSDERDRIADAVNALRGAYDYVFTTGGIGPTHDDITADSIAYAFGVPIGHHAEAMDILTRHYKQTGGEFTDARKRMARIPEGATLIPNSVSKAPGFQLDNVFVMAGIPIIVQVMMDALSPRLEGGAKMVSRTIECFIGESAIAEGLGEVQSRYPNVGIGSYPFYRDNQFGTSLVLRSVDSSKLGEAVAETIALAARAGGKPVERAAT
ncbi:MAG: molybdopterin-binding protein [Parvibaculum sp.]